ncbi:MULTISPECIES: hypothetical protein [Rhodopseudomonas]|uniref:hypothetical protein n=1 Tax=Rhodopseudomonas TaxID=1073 RepID=UPI0024C035C9|nr:MULTISPECIES: hypothetical protein [Rhodopseudomonas]
MAAELAEIRARDEALAACIDRIVEGHYDTAAPGGDDPLSRAIGRLLQTLSGNVSRNLDRMVDLSIQTSETAVASANLLSFSRQIDQRSQALASASEELVTSIGQIGVTAQKAASEAADMRVSAQHGLATANTAASAMSRVSTTAELAAEKIAELSAASDAIGSIVSSIDATRGRPTCSP